MDTSKEEIVNLRKQINRLKISLMFTQVLMIALLLILGYQCLWSIWNYHYLLQQISMSAIRAKCDWNRFKQLIGAKTTTATVDKYYHTRKSWADSKSQIGAYKSLENAKKEWKEGYTIYDWNGKAVYPVEKTSAITLTKEIKVQLPVIKKGSSGAAVSSLQAVLGVEVDGSFGNDTETSLKVFQKNVAITADGSCGTDTWTKVFEHMKANTK